VKTVPYRNNGLNRIKNIIFFYKNLFHVVKKYKEKHGKPDVILASSVHPLTLVAGIKIAKKLGIPCICEVRDLWPESLVAYGTLNEKSIITKLLYFGEKWIYKRADKIIMTWQGGKDYIVDKCWEKKVSLSKVKYISNGVVIDTFDKNSEEYVISDPDLDNKNYKNIIYTGSIRKVNNLGLILNVARIIQDKGYNNIRFLIYGSGNQMQQLKKRCEMENITNVIFKGSVDKKYVPSILTKSDINILHNSSTSLDKYGQSKNKLFEYLASGNCIIQTYTTGYSICDKYKCGVSPSIQNEEQIAKIIIDTINDNDKRRFMGINARQAAYDFDFSKLTNKLIDIIESL